jgi:hypothetical protein
LQFDDAQRTLTAGDDDAGVVGGDDRARRATALDDASAPELDDLAVQRTARAGEGVEGAQPALEHGGGQCPVDRRLALVDLGRVGRPCVGLRLPPAAALRRAASASTISCAPSAARRSCRDAAVSSAAIATGCASSMSPVSSPASICITVMPVCVPGFDRALDRRRAAPARQQRGMDVQAAESRQFEQPGGRIRP